MQLKNTSQATRRRFFALSGAGLISLTALGCSGSQSGPTPNPTASPTPNPSTTPSPTPTPAPSTTYTFSVLPASGGLSSGEARGGAGAQQVGKSFGSGIIGEHATLWNGATGAVVDLHPAGKTSSRANASSGDKQGGSAVNSVTHAMLWSGSAASALDLHPGAGTFSEILGMGGTQQVGTFNSHAALWQGTAASFVDLDTGNGALSSQAFDTDGVHQVGIVKNSAGKNHATLWSGTAASAVDLHPTALVGTAEAVESFAEGVHGSQQVGALSLRFVGLHAAIWSGSSTSVQDIHPTQLGRTNSLIRATNGAQQVGKASNSLGVTDIAVVWSGTAASAINLQALIPASFGTVKQSEAQGISESGDIVGFVDRQDGSTVTRVPVIWKKN